jgi:predicted kinase
MKTTLILFSGLPGSGKTTLARMVARHLRIPLLGKDRFQSALRTHGLAARATPDGYHLMLDLADEQLSLEVSIILDAVFPKDGFRLAARDIARRNGANFRAIYCYCSDETIWQERMKERQEFVPNWTPVDWDEVQRLRAFYQPWDPQTTLFIDSLNDLSENLALTLRWIQENCEAI